MAELMDGEIRCKPTLQVPRIVIQTAIKDGAKFYSSDPLRWLGEKPRLRCKEPRLRSGDPGSSGIEPDTLGNDASVPRTRHEPIPQNTGQHERGRNKYPKIHPQD